ncbi:kinase-like domain-containing protein [Colletotrichum phormii]|uniref:Kinase-like domain-containing protein n=1 Tax=Colletotrichum phormii TaxID=359342 RepID=A0AAI9ZDE2_9PEZI|nr:kinase-like domain-containing protein [Colletotrichum phormii]KAK1622207.1 kinase-like domain-containing protein [Colletotrichum phormii]
MSSYDAFRRDIRNQLRAKLMRGDSTNQRFAITGTSKEVLTATQLECLFDTLLIGHMAERPNFRIDKHDFSKLVQHRELHDFLAVLLFARCPVEAARAFTLNLVYGNIWTEIMSSESGMLKEPPRRSLLPTDRDFLNRIFDADADTVDMFYDTQACFSTVVIRCGKEETGTVVEVLERCRLPYIREKPLGSGSYGDVYEVEVAKGHFVTDGDANSQPKVLARKDYKIRSADDFREEAKTMNLILQSTSKHDNILKSIGTLEIRTDPLRFSLFMELAIDNLDNYLMIGDPSPKLDVEDRIRFLRSALGLANGLRFLHTQMMTPDGQEMVCYHMDLKPSNVLIFKDTRQGSHEKDRIWKVSDFGMSRVKMPHNQTLPHVAEGEFDFNRMFNKQAQSNTVSRTQGRVGISTYLPSEALSPERSMNQKSDVWSLGCIISVLFTYLEDGADGIQQYQKSRRKENGNTEEFFKRGYLGYKINPAVRQCHSKLIDKASSRNSLEKGPMSFMLDFLEKRVLQPDQKDRCDAKMVADHLRQTVEKYKGTAVPKESADEPKSKRRVLDRFTLLPDQDGVEQWKLEIAAPASLKGCNTSPDGSIIYWSDSCLFLLTSASNENVRKNFLRPIGRYRLEDGNGFWKAAMISRRYLVATTTGSDSKCFIFRLQGGHAETPSLEEAPSIISLSNPVHKLVLLEDRNIHIVFWMSEDKDDDTRSVLVRARVSQPSLLSTETSFVPQNDAAFLTDEKRFSLKWPVSDIVHLCMKTSSEGHIVVRPKDQSHMVSIKRISLTELGTETIGQIRFESFTFTPEGPSGNTSSLFTTIAHFHKKLGVIVIAHEKQMFEIGFSADGVSAREPKLNIIDKYRLLKIVVDETDETFIALGRQSADHRVSLLRITRTGLHGQPSVHKIVELGGLSDSDEAMLALAEGEDMGKKVVLVTALVSLDRSAVYKVLLPR